MACSSGASSSLLSLSVSTAVLSEAEEDEREDKDEDDIARAEGGLGALDLRRPDVRGLFSGFAGCAFFLRLVVISRWRTVVARKCDQRLVKCY